MWTRFFYRAIQAVFAFILIGWAGLAAQAQVLTENLEIKLIEKVGASWVKVPLQNEYARPVVICTYNLPSKTDPPATTRVRNVGATSFEVRIQQFENNNTVTDYFVHCIISNEGAYKLDSGVRYEAYTVTSTGTSGSAVAGTWTNANTEDVTSMLTLKYPSPVVLGQVMTFNDAKASVFWTNNCDRRQDPPFVTTSKICVGKHIGMIPGTRDKETIGFIVADTGDGVQNDIYYELALGADSVRGTGDSPPYNYAVSEDYDIGVTSQNAEDGGNGSWSVLYGNDPLNGNIISNAVEEETAAGDTTRRHTHEQVSYWVFLDKQYAELKSEKTVAMSPVSVSPYAIPGADLVYTITVENTGSKPVDVDSVFLVDALPDESIFYNNDIDDGGPQTGRAVFSSVGSGLSLNPLTDMRFSTGPSKPTSFAGCTTMSLSGYEPSVKFVCFNPKGTFNSGSFGTSKFSIQFRVALE